MKIILIFLMIFSTFMIVGLISILNINREIKKLEKEEEKIRLENEKE